MRSRRFRELKHRLQPELNLPRRADDLRNRSRVAGADGRVRQVELRCIEEIEDLRPELQPHALTDAKLLEQGKVEIHTPSSVQDIAAGIAVCELRGRRKRGNVEPSVNGWILEFAVPQPIWPADGSCIGCRRSECRR